MTKTEINTFFDRPADVVAEELLGHMLCVRQSDGNIERHTINETEAYVGPHDLACHAAKGRTKRTEVMFREAGTIYVYLIYGMYTMLNIVTGDEDYPAAVLIRGAGAYDGPGKLTRALHVCMEHNAQLLGKQAGIWIARPKGSVHIRVQRTPRVGVGYAGPWAKKPLRFIAASAS